MTDNILNSININKLKTVLIIFSILLSIFPTLTNAVSVPVSYKESYTYYRYHKIGGCGGPPDFKAYTAFGMNLRKQFDLTADGVKTLAQNESVIIPKGVNLTASNYPVTGSYWYSSGDSATPTMDGQVYNWNYNSSGGACAGGYAVNNQMRGGITSQLDYTLSSSNNNIIDCSGGKSCRTKNNGTATVTVSFPGSGSYYLQRSYQWGYNYSTSTYNAICRSVLTGYGKFSYYNRVCSCRNSTHSLKYYTRYTKSGGYTYGVCTSTEFRFRSYGGDSWTGAWRYSLNPISYTMTVQRPNQAPVVRYTGTNNIDYNTATANWSYSDADGDAQTQSQVQIATDSGYNNIVYSNTNNGTGTSMGISGLAHSTTYYPRVRVRNNVNGWTGWINGAAFRTKVNNPPNLELLGCSATSGGTDYEKARLTWNYTGTDDPGDELVLRARWKRSPEDNSWTVVNLGNNRTGSIDMLNLISGYTYDLKVSLNDNRNSNLGDRWKGCGTVTPPNYPEPTVEFSLNRSGDGTPIRNGQTLVVKTLDRVNANWDITNTVGVSSCKVDTTGGDGIKLFYSTSFNGSLNKIMPINVNDLTYIVSLNCTGRPAKVQKTVNQSITLVVESYPVVSCSIQGDNTVREGDISVNINATVDNATSYTWEAGPDSSREGTNKKTGNSPIPNPLTLEYTRLDFGRYNPWVRLTKPVSGAPSRQVSTKCGTVTNFGRSTIREVNP